MQAAKKIVFMRRSMTLQSDTFVPNESIGGVHWESRLPKHNTTAVISSSCHPSSVAEPSVHDRRARKLWRSQMAGPIDLPYRRPHAVNSHDSQFPDCAIRTADSRSFI